MKSRIILVHFLSLLVFLVLPLHSQAVQKPEIDISLSTDSLAVTAYSADIYLRIGGPDGYFRELRGNDYLQWSPDAGATDGNYRYDCYVSSGVPRDGSISEEAMEGALEASSSSSHGVFQVENGRLLGDDEAPAESPDDSLLPAPLGMLKPSDDATENNFWSAIGGLLNLLVPPAQALNTINDDVQINGYLYVVGSGGYLNYNDTTSDLYLTGGSYYLLDNAPKFFVYDESTTDYNWYFDFNDTSFKLVDTVGANVNNAISITAQSGTTNTNNSFVVDTLGDIGLADNAVFIDRSADEVGIGTLSPAGSLHIMDDALPELILEDTGAGSTRWELEASTAELHVYGYNSTSFTSVYPFRINNDARSNTLALGNTTTGTSNVGMGTNDPETGLHMLHYDGNGIIKVQEQNGTKQKRFQVQLENNGPTGFLFTDTSTADRQWQVSTTTNGGYMMSFLGTGGSEFTIASNGAVTIGPGPVTNFTLKANGDLSINNGTVTATDFITSSSRVVKKNIKQVNEREVMDKLATLEITEWEYKDPEIPGTHLGPMAEDFYALFKLGSSDKHVSPRDMAAISLVAAKQLNSRLNKELSVLRMQNEELRAGNEDLRERLSELEALIAKLASSQ